MRGSIRVEPGVQLVFQENAGFLVSGIFSARGTEMSPVVLQGATSSPGYWNGLQYTNSESAENVLEHVVIRDGGGSEFRGRRGGLVLQQSTGSGVPQTRLTVSHLTIENSRGHGIDADAITFSGFENVTITSSEEDPISLPASVVGQLTATTTLTGNARDLVEIRGGDLGQDARWPALDIPYLLSDDLFIEAHLDLLDPMLIRVAENVEWYIQRGGSMEARGEGSRSVVIEGFEDRRGYWSGLIFVASNSLRNRLDRFEIVNGGGIEFRERRANIVLSDGANVDDVTITIARSEIRSSAGYGIAADDRVNLTFSQNTFIRNQLAPLQIAPVTAYALDKDSFYMGNDDDVISVYEGGFSTPGQLARTNVPYRFEGDINVTSDLEIAAGATLAFEETVFMEVSRGGSLSAIGTASAPIEFVGAQPVAGYWTGLRFSTSERFANRLEHVRIAHGGRQEFRGMQANLILRGAPSTSTDDVTIALVDVRLEDGLAAGVEITTPILLTACERVTAQNVSSAVVVDGSASNDVCNP